MTQATARPGLQEILVAGTAPVRNLPTYGWYFAVMIVISGIVQLVGERGTPALIIASFAPAYFTLALARQLMTGRLVFLSYDLISLARMVAVGLALFIAIAVLYAVLIALEMLGLALLGFTMPSWLVSFAFMVIAFCLTARLVFYPAGLALVDPVSIKAAFAQGADHWGRLILLLLITSIPAVVLTALIAALKMPMLANAVVFGAIGGLTNLIVTSAVCYLYVTYVRGEARLGA